MTTTVVQTWFMVTVVLLSWCGSVTAQLPIEYEVEYPPLYRGLDSQGGMPEPQMPNPVFFFEEKVNWPALRIEQPRTAWEYAQRGIHRQDNLEDIDGAKADYEQSEAMNRRILIVQARLGVIALLEGRFDDAITHLDFVLEEAPFHEGVHLKLGEAYEDRFEITNNPEDLRKAEEEFKAELQLAPTVK